MHYPTLHTIPAAREAVDTFRGLNQGGDIRPGEFAQEENMQSGHYPWAASCKAPGLCLEGQSIQGLTAKESLCYVSGGELAVGENRYRLGLTPGEKQLISMGAYLIILPDKVYFNTADPQDWGPVEQTVREQMWHLYPCDAQGNLRTIRFRGSTTPTDAQNGDFWYDTSRQTPRLLTYNAQTQTWGHVQGYVQLHLDYWLNDRWPYDGYFTDNFQTGDTLELEISGNFIQRFDGPEPLEDEQLAAAVKALEGTAEVTVLDGVNLVIPGVLPEQVSIGNQLRLSRSIPQMDFLFECGNRLWGCRYGLQGGKFVNEIYASALGDFRNWSGYQGVSTDAYRVSLGTDGPFTGAINYLGYPLFFKENCLHRVYGSYPGEYRVQTVPCQGPASGCGGSLCLLGDTALYLGRNGVCAYDGAMPSLISRGLRDLTGPAVGAVTEEVYYLSTPQGLFVYDSRRTLWHRRSPMAASQMCALGGKVYCLCPEAAGLRVLDGGEEDVAFSFTTGILAGPRQQLVRGIALRYSLRGWARVMVEYDSSGFWQAAGALTPHGLGWAHLSLKPRRCDHFRLRIMGQGALRLHSIIKTLEKGSDLP